MYFWQSTTWKGWGIKFALSSPKKKVVLVGNVGIIHVKRENGLFFSFSTSETRRITFTFNISHTFRHQPKVNLIQFSSAFFGVFYAYSFLRQRQKIQSWEGMKRIKLHESARHLSTLLLSGLTIYLQEGEAIFDALKQFRTVFHTTLLCYPSC